MNSFLWILRGLMFDQLNDRGNFRRKTIYKYSNVSHFHIDVPNCKHKFTTQVASLFALNKYFSIFFAGLLSSRSIETPFRFVHTNSTS